MTVDTVLLKVASRCNLNCRYCYIYHSPDSGWRQQPGRMSIPTIDAVVSRLSKFRKQAECDFAIVLHGGEPLLLGKAKLDRLLSNLRSGLGKTTTIAMQTNGVLLDDDHLAILAQTHTLTAVSIDGPSVVNDKYRLDLHNRSSFARTIAAIERLKRHPQSRDFFRGVLAVVDPRSDPVEVYSFFKQLDVPSVDFLFRDGNHDRLPEGKQSFYSTEYGHWMSRIWELYVSDPNPTPIECLDNLVRQLLGKNSKKEGAGETDFGILVVETDGTIAKNDTLKNSYDGADQFHEQWSVHTHSILDIAKSEEYRRYRSNQRTQHKACLECPLLRVCGGGMQLHRWSNAAGYDNPSIYCNDQKFLSNSVIKKLKSEIVYA